VLLIYTSTVTNRLRYIVNLLFNEIYGMQTVFSLSLEEYLQYDGPKIAYGKEDPGEGLFIESSGFLFEQIVFPYDVQVGNFRDIPVLFQSATRHEGFPFDILSASFYLVSRYEEYTADNHDKYGRFPVTGSLAYSAGFLEKPVVNIWLKLCISRLQQLYPQLMTHQHPYYYIPTVDIDHAYAYRYRPPGRMAGGIGRSLSGGRMNEVTDRFRVMTGLKQDPYDTYGYIKDLHQRNHLSTLWFILMADYGGDDNNIPIHGKGINRLVESIASWSELGIHPSLASNKYLSKLKSEINGLETLTGRKVTKSRQHFLKFSLPETFHQLAQMGITDEYSMGYATHPGFRAGIAHPFLFFDLSRDTETTLRLHPIPVMDVTFRDHLQLNQDESLQRIKQIADHVRSCNGEFITLWHNESLSEYGRWKGWRSLYEKVQEIATA